jgi:hypothetical protein
MATSSKPLKCPDIFPCKAAIACKRSITTALYIMLKLKAMPVVSIPRFLNSKLVLGNINCWHPWCSRHINFKAEKDVWKAEGATEEKEIVYKWEKVANAHCEWIRK